VISVPELYRRTDIQTDNLALHNCAVNSIAR